MASQNFNTSSNLAVPDAGSAANPSIQFLNSSKTGFFLKSDSTIGIACGGVEIGNFSTTGASFVQSISDTMALNLTAVTNQLVLGTTNTTTLSATAPAASAVYTIPDVGTTGNIMLDQGAYTVAGVLTFSAAPIFSAASNQFAVKPGANKFIFTAASPAADRTLTIPDPGVSAANVMLDQGAYTVAGALTLSSALTLTAASNQLVIAPGGKSYTITGATPASNLTYTIPDAGSAASFVMTAGTQTVAGIKSFSGNLCTNRANVASTATIASLASTTSYVKLTGSTATDLQGIAAGVDGQLLILTNLTGQTLTIRNQSASAASGAKIRTMTGADITTTANGAAGFIYDTDASPAEWCNVWNTA